MVITVQAKGLSERAGCRWSGVSRRVAQYEARRPELDQGLEAAIRGMVCEHPEHGYRQIAGLLNESEDRVRRLWERLGLKAQRPMKTRQKRDPTSNPRPHRAEYPDHVWSYDFMHDRLFGGSSYRLLNLLDEYTRECMTIHVARSIKSADVICVLAGVMRATNRVPAYLRSDNGSEFSAAAVTDWLETQQVGPAFIDRGSPWQNGFIESFNGKIRVELLKREWFKSLEEARIMIEQWRCYYNNQRPHSALGRLPPAKFAAAQNAAA